MGEEAVYYIGVGHERPGYDTIAAWESATQIDCVASGAVIIGELVHTQVYDEDSLVIAGATTDADNFRMLRPAPSSLGSGIRGSGPSVYSDLGGFAAVINVQEDDFKIVDLEIAGNGDAQGYGVFVTGVSRVQLSGLVVHNHTECGISFVGASGAATNCIVHHTAATPARTGAMVGTNGDETAFVARHCTALAETTHGSKDVTGFRYMVAQNCIVANYGTAGGHACFLNLGDGSTNNASTDASATNFGTSGINTIDPAAIFINVASGLGATNLHLKSWANVRGKASGIPAGLSGIPVDIDKEALRTEPWDAANSGTDMGADQWYPVGGVNVLEADNDLVFLFRYGAWDTPDDEVLDSDSQSPAFTGLNTFSVSGSHTKLSGPGIQASGSSGVMASGSSLEIFHLPDAAQGSGNASGVELTSSQDASWGSWVLMGGEDDPQSSFMDVMGKNALGSGIWKLTIHSGVATNPEWAWRMEAGINDGASTTVIRNVDEIQSGVWQHVVCTLDSDTTTDNAKLYVSGVLRASGNVTFAPAPSGAQPGIHPDPHASGHPPTRLFSTCSKTAEFVANGAGGHGMQLAETFFMRKELTEAQVLGIYNSGFIGGATEVAPNTGVFQSDLNDTLKDTIGAQAAAGASEMRITAWNANDGADPSGFRHMTSGYHPAFLKMIGSTAASGLNFGDIKQHTASGIRAITFRNMTPETAVNNIRFWLADATAFAGVNGWEVSEHIDSKWLPNLTLPSGSGVVGRTLGDASTVLQSNLDATMSGATLDGAITSGESGISQYIYLSFVTNENFVPDTYGTTGFGFRITMDGE